MLTIDKLFTCSLSEFYEINNNYETYKDYDVVNINKLDQPYNINSVLENATRSMPRTAEVVVNFKIVLLSNSVSSYYFYYSGQALVPKPNNQGGQNDNNS